jgi:quercetin dioxygenase-like cupin family protein
MTLVQQEIETNYIGSETLPWMPFTPLTDEVEMKYYRVDPVRAEILVSMRFPGGLTLPPHYHTGIVIAHTIKGAWRYQEHDWVSRAGDTVYETAGSSHTPESLEDTEVFFFLVGELLFFNEDKQLLWQENWKTSVERYTNYCREHGIEPQDITSFTE